MKRTATEIQLLEIKQALRDKLLKLKGLGITDLTLYRRIQNTLQQLEDFSQSKDFQKQPNILGG